MGGFNIQPAGLSRAEAAAAQWDGGDSRRAPDLLPRAVPWPARRLLMERASAQRIKDGRMLLWIIGFSLLGSIGALLAAALFLLFPAGIRQVLLPHLLSYATGTP
ncbi:MAG TPA: hypothetical protein VKA14_04160, partial [Gammaproteobacteria bacterium]|nr:hypothetical protein [Gammaproteobacteria bacterium]